MPILDGKTTRIEGRNTIMAALKAELHREPDRWRETTADCDHSPATLKRRCHRELNSANDL